MRGIRLCLQRTDLFEAQLRAILRAAKGGYIRIMFPMIAQLEDIRAAKAVLESVRATLDAPPVEVGMMVEVPSAVLMADAFAAEVDFFSVGTNDLTQYLLAMDRGHPVLAKQADALHPAVLRAIDQTVRAAEAAGKWVGVCGGVASEPLGAMLLAGLGVKELSVDIPTIATVKATLRGRSLSQLQKLAQRSLRCRTVFFFDEEGASLMITHCDRDALTSGRLTKPLRCPNFWPNTRLNRVAWAQAPLQAAKVVNVAAFYLAGLFF